MKPKPEQPGESVLHKHAHLHPLLGVGYSSDSIQVRPGAEGSTSATDNEAFPFRPALQLTHLLLQLHHHAACEDRIRSITCGRPPSTDTQRVDPPTLPEKAFMREGLLTVSTATPDSCLSRSTEPPGKACSFSLISSWLKLWILELLLSSNLGRILTRFIHTTYGYKVICCQSNPHCPYSMY